MIVRACPRMGLFRKKADPLAQRANSLNRRIAELEAEIAKLNQNLTPPPGRRPTAGGMGTAPASASAAAPAASPSPTRPPPAAHEPVFERMPPRPVDPRGAAPDGGKGGEGAQLGLKRRVWSRWWQRLRAQVAEPQPSNEKLVSYLAAGGIQGLRPLRFERRVARNRIIFVCVVLGLLLWGLLVMFRHAP